MKVDYRTGGPVRGLPQPPRYALGGLVDSDPLATPRASADPLDVASGRFAQQQTQIPRFAEGGMVESGRPSENLPEPLFAILRAIADGELDIHAGLDAFEILERAYGRARS